MIKIGIIGANTQIAGELLRILINHPEADIVSLLAPDLPGRSVSSVHHGFIGESPLLFSDKLNLENLDIIFILDNSPLVQNILRESEKYPDLKIISLTEQGISNDEIGISEINRKALVRGAIKSFIPHPVVVTSLIALVPLARFMLLNSEINIEVTLPEDLAKNPDIKHFENLIADILIKNQASFKDKISIKLISDKNNSRGIATKILINSQLPLQEVENVYDQIYDDHNFTFHTNNKISNKEVEGTHKYVMQISKPTEEELMIQAFADARLRGGAGDAVHVMNLFFGLHEKTGLSFKPAVY